MRKEFIFGIISLVIIALINISGAQANDKSAKILTSYKKDLTGDDQFEHIQIKKNSGNKNSNKIEITISTSNKKTFNIPYTGDKVPKVSFVDYNQDHITDIFIMSPKTKGGTPSEFQLFSLINEQLTKIKLPDALTLEAQFENDYQASIRINESGAAYTLDLHDQKKDFDQKGLYQNGSLNEPTELMVHSFDKLNPVRLKDMSVGLKGRQPIGEEYDGILIAYVDSTWKWVNSSWELQSTELKKIMNK